MTDLTAKPASTVTDADDQERAQKILHEAATYFDAGPGGVDALFEAFRQFGEIISAHHAAERKAKKDARNARRRARRAASPKPTPKPKTPAVEIDAEYDVEEGCRCQVVRMPPCSWCESGGSIDEDAA